jgi:hypothetical protein
MIKKVAACDFLLIMNGFRARNGNSWAVSFGLKINREKNINPQSVLASYGGGLLGTILMSSV